MQFVPIDDLAMNLATLRHSLQNDEEIILTDKGVPIGMFTAVWSDNIEEDVVAIRRERTKLALNRIRRQAKVSASAELSSKQTNEIIARTRRARGE